MDVLSDMLHTVRVTSQIRCRAEFTAPWGIAVPARPESIPFYVLAQGSGYLEVEGMEAPVALVSGDVVMLPYGTAHQLRDSPQSVVTPLDAMMKHEKCNGTHRLMRGEGNGAPTTVIAGTFTIANRVHPILSGISPLVHMRTTSSCPVPWLDATLQLIAAESSSERPGSQITVSRLMDVLFIQLVRADILEHVDRGHNCKQSVLYALSDAQLARGINAIHRDPSRSWTVAELASEAGMSRTAFSVRFSKMAGISPLAYATQWRMIKATDMLVHGEGTIAEIAGAVGYESEAAFGKAFKREVGMAPGRYREQWRNPMVSQKEAPEPEPEEELLEA